MRRSTRCVGQRASASARMRASQLPVSVPIPNHWHDGRRRHHARFLRQMRERAVPRLGRLSLVQLSSLRPGDRDAHIYAIATTQTLSVVGHSSLARAEIIRPAQVSETPTRG